MRRSQPTRAARILGLAAALAAAFFVGDLDRAAAREDGRFPPPTDQPAWSAQLHLHGSFSEGTGSIDSHSYQASRLGVDVLWWSDHGFRLAGYRHPSTFGFERAEEPMDENEPWRQRLRHKDVEIKQLTPSALSTTTGSATFTADESVEGQRSLRVRSAGPTAAFASYLQEFSAKRHLHSRCLASVVSLELSILPEEIGPDARPVVEVPLSEHAPRGGNPFAQYALRYYLSNVDSGPRRAATTFHVPLRYDPGQWNHYTLDLTLDAREGFPFMVADDNIAESVHVGVETRSSASCSALFDRLRLNTEHAGTSMMAIQRDVIDEVAAEYPQLAELQGLEISYESMHLNEFAVGTVLPDYEALLQSSGLLDEDGMITGSRKLREHVVRTSVEAAHARGGLISYNHMFGTGGDQRLRAGHDREEVLQYLTENRCFGADLLEVGYRMRGGRALDSHLWVWDRLSLAGLPLVGTGVSDFHGGLGADGWKIWENNFVSWIFAPSTARTDLIEGLRGGRVFFGDITAFDGRLDLVTTGGFRMGSIVVTDRPHADVQISVLGVGSRNRIVVVDSGLRARRKKAGGTDVRLVHRVELGERDSAFVRVEVYDSSSRAVVFSNPIWFVRAPGPAGLEGIPAARAGIEVAGARSVKIEGITLDQVRAEGAGAATGVRITGRAESGAIVLDCGAGRVVRAVELDGMEGTWSFAGGRLQLSALEGEGSVTVRW